jgi:hypothetical protein
MPQTSQVRPSCIPQDAPVIPSTSIPAYPSSLPDTPVCRSRPKSINTCIPLLAPRYPRMLWSSQVRRYLHTPPHSLIPQDAPVVPSPSIPAYPSSLPYTPGRRGHPKSVILHTLGRSSHPEYVDSCIPLLTPLYPRTLQSSQVGQYLHTPHSLIPQDAAVIPSLSIAAYPSSLCDTPGRSGRPKSFNTCIPLLTPVYPRILRSYQVRQYLHTPPHSLIPQDAAIIPSPSIPAYPSSLPDTSGHCSHPKYVDSCIPPPHSLIPQDAAVIPSLSILAYPSSLPDTPGCSGHPQVRPPLFYILTHSYA